MNFARTTLVTPSLILHASNRRRAYWEYESQGGSLGKVCGSCGGQMRLQRVPPPWGEVRGLQDIINKILKCQKIAAHVSHSDLLILWHSTRQTHCGHVCFAWPCVRGVNMCFKSPFTGFVCSANRALWTARAPISKNTAIQTQQR